MKIAINLVFIAIAAFLAYMLYGSISEPVSFQAEKEKRQTAVVDELTRIRKAQEYYRAITGEFAPSFDTLKQVLTEGEFTIVKIEGDPDDASGEKVVRTETKKSAKDSLATLGFSLDGLGEIPFADGKMFDVKADTTTYQSTLVNVVEVSTKIANYMGPFADAKFRKYDAQYDPNKTIKFGSMTNPTLSGNWE